MPDNTKEKEEPMFSYGDAADQKKYQRRNYISIGLGGATILSLIILGSVFYNNLALFSLIFSFYCIYLWILPLFLITLRSYQFSKNSKREQKIGRIYMVFAFYFLFLWVASLTGLLIYLGGGAIAWMAAVLFWISLCVFVPYLLFVLIARL
ncbi:MAG: hypothetical protein JW776_02460 [Candidatus Lokiarchaeota archaeon]|nr:hypothetical protein [Candidatus Lokiarchaeota archaeon]